LEVLVRVAETGSLTRAAEVLGVTQQAVYPRQLNPRWHAVRVGAREARRGLLNNHPSCLKIV
ncbi:helix-turn-helix domain-containing protein, partial [Micrococcus luteus]|uniref:helix-turn-helix domain-containing protein n=1 Tax=Micrococcus luteus TaxID=1270 RepID=UPI00342F6EF2